MIPYEIVEVVIRIFWIVLPILLAIFAFAVRYCFKNRPWAPHYDLCIKIMWAVVWIITSPLIVGLLYILGKAWLKAIGLL